MAKIILMKKAEVLAEYDLGTKDAVKIGSLRKDNDIIVPDKNVSEHHCSIERHENKYQIKDHSTLTGTKVDGRSVTTADLRPGSVINLGNYNLIFKDDSAPGAGLLLATSNWQSSGCRPKQKACCA